GRPALPAGGEIRRRVALQMEAYEARRVAQGVEADAGDVGARAGQPEAAVRAARGGQRRGHYAGREDTEGAARAARAGGGRIGMKPEAGAGVGFPPSWARRASAAFTAGR